MTLRGSLSDLPLTDLVQIVAANRKTGKLRVTTLHGDGLLVFRAGKIVYGATSSHREGFGSFLLLHHLVTEEQLQKALDRQASSSDEQRLSGLLVDMEILSEADLREVLRAQLCEVMGELLRWRQGVVEFEEIELSPHGEVSVDGREFVVREGVGASGIMLALVDLEQQRELSPKQQFLAQLGWVARPPEPSPAAAPLPTQSLSSIRRELATPVWTGEAALAILRAASRFVSRGVLLMRAPDGFRGLAQFGIWPEGETERVRGLRISHQATSLITDVARGKKPFRGEPDPRPHNLLFFRFLESDPPPEVVLLPVVVDDETRLLFYGDNLLTRAPIPATDALEEILQVIVEELETSLDVLPEVDDVL